MLEENKGNLILKYKESDRMKKLLWCLVLLCLCGCGNKNAEEPTEEVQRIEVSIETIDFERLSRQEIQISWTDEYELPTCTYVVKRKSFDAEWIEVARVEKEADKETFSIVDELEEAYPQQYEYRIDVEFTSETEANTGDIVYEVKEGKSILASNVMICIDPGHYDIAREAAEADEYHYVEGNFVLEIALELQRELKKVYGIDSYMTRDSGNITIDGYSDEELDSAHISLRGEYAVKEDSNLYISIHTNSNKEDANGYETFFQPLEINKPMLILNATACEDVYAMNVANAIGVNLAQVNFEQGLATHADFDEKAPHEIGEWTQEYNDGLDKVGTLVKRTGKKGDYYGILRGAANVDIPGMIIEHGYHSVQEVRKAAIEGNLSKEWAKADAKGIAQGFGFEK